MSSGIPNFNLNLTAPLAHAAAALGQPVVGGSAEAPGLVPDQLALSPQAAPATGDPDAQLAQVRQQLAMGDPVQASMALYQLPALAGTRRDQVVAILVDQLSSSGSPQVQIAAMDLLQNLKAQEALPMLQSIQTTSSTATVRDVARQVAMSLAPSAAPAMLPGAPALPTAAPAAGAATPPATGLAANGAIPTATAQSAPATAGAGSPPAAAAPPTDAAGLTAALLDANRAPAAAMQLAKLPLPQILAITGPLIGNPQVDRRTITLFATILGHHATEPGAAQQLRQIVNLTPQDVYVEAIGYASVGLAMTHNPAYLADQIKVLTMDHPFFAKPQKVILDVLASQPEALANPQLTAAIGHVLNTRDIFANGPLVAAASHALANTRSAQARDLLGSSPLLTRGGNDQALRGMWDLDKQPPPYGPQAIKSLSELARSTTPQVAQMAKSLLKKTGAPA